MASQGAVSRKVGSASGELGERGVRLSLLPGLAIIDDANDRNGPRSEATHSKNFLQRSS